MNLPDLSIRNPVTACMILLCLIVLGTISSFKIPVEMLPDVDFPQVTVNVPYHNASPEQVERTITKPLEEVLATVAHVKNINSSSQSDGCNINMEFDWGLDIDLIRAEIREKVEQARADLPDDVDRIFVQNFRSSDIPVIEGRISSGRDLRGHYELLEQRIKKPLERVRGVADVEIGGVTRQEIAIELRMDDLQRYRVDVGTLFRRLDAANLNISLGKVRESGQRFSILARNSLTSIEQIRKFPVNELGLRLADIANIELSEPLRTYGRHLNGQYAIAISIRKSSDANTVETVRRIKEKIEEINQEPSMQGINLLIWNDTAKEITESLEGLLNSGAIGALLAVAVLFIFLRRIGATLVVGFAIPFSILSSIGIIYICGKTLNVLSMMGLMLSAGMLVDNAVVVLESIFRNLEKGRDRLSAAKTGSKEVLMAVIASTLTSIIIFVPLIFGRKNEFSTWLSEVGIAIIITLCCSLLVSLVLIPLSISRFIQMRPLHTDTTRTRLARTYQRVLEWTFKHRAITVSSILFVVVISVLPFSALPDNTPQSRELRDLRIQYEFSENYHYAHIEEKYINPVEQYLAKNKQRWLIKDVYSYFGNGAASTSVYFDVERITPDQLTQFREQLQESLPVIPGATISMGRQRGADTTNWVGVNFYGEDTQMLNRLVADAKRELRRNKEVKELNSAEERSTEEVQISLRRDLAGKFGISAQEVGQVLGIVLRGRQVRGFHNQEGEVEIWVRLQDRDRSDIQDLRNMVIRNAADGSEILLSQVADLQIVKTAQSIERENRCTHAFIGVVCNLEDREQSRQLVRNVMERMHYPIGYTWSFDRFVAEQDESNQEFLFNMLLALFMVYFVMASLFESLAHPFAIMFSLPFAFVGVAWFLFITHTPFNMMSQIGLLILIGLVVNNGIVLIDHINNYRRQGFPRLEAVRSGCLERLRPIMMTAGTTILGLIPLAFGTTSIAGMRYFPMARTVMGGLIASTLLTLIVLPTIYCLIDDLALAARRLWIATKPAAIISPTVPPSATAGQGGSE